MHVAGVFVYPVKSCGAVALPEATLDECGLLYDRRWIVAKKSKGDNMAMLTQRAYPKLATVRCFLTSTHLELRAPSQAVPLRIPLPAPLGDVDAQRAEANATSTKVDVWDAVGVSGIDEGDVAAQWFSSLVNTPVRMLRKSQSPPRLVGERPGKEAPDDLAVAFPDSFPLSVASQESLRDLNSRLVRAGHDPVPMDRFRPNIVLARAPAPHAEDTWVSMKVGGLTLRAGNPCLRCVMTTMDQETGERPSAQPLALLKQYRMHKEKKRPFFAWYYYVDAAPRAGGVVRVGDDVRVLEQRRSAYPGYTYTPDATTPVVVGKQASWGVALASATVAAAATAAMILRPWK